MTASKEKRVENKALSIRKALSKRAEVILPYQYYSQIGEAIYCLEADQIEGSDRSYLHVDAEGQTLAEVQLGENPPNKQGIHLDEIAKFEAKDEEFGALMHEMHVAARSSGQIVDLDEMRHLRSLSRKEPILIGGCGRSGTTLLLSILGAHPDILAFPEEMYAFTPFPFRLSKIIEEIEAQEKLSWLHWCEKTPKNVMAFPEIFSVFEGQVRLIHIVRDGRDVVTSHHPNASERYYISPKRWVADVSAGWQHREKTLLIRYEDLVARAQETLELVCEYIGLPFDERMLSFERHSKVTENKAWEGRSARALNNDSIARWKAPEHSQRVADFKATSGAEELMALLDYV